MDKILIIDDDQDFSRLLNDKLSEAGYDPVTEHEGRSGFRRALVEEYALIILDLRLPDIDGFDLCRELRENDRAVPLMIVSGRDRDADCIAGLDAGADDFVSKPFEMPELLARVRALLRRAPRQASPDAKLTFGELVIYPAKRRVTYQSSPLRLSAVEFALLLAFAFHPGRVFSREDLIEEVWGARAPDAGKKITTHLSRLRAKLEPSPRHPVFIKTVRGSGYRFVTPDEVTVKHSSNLPIAGEH